MDDPIAMLSGHGSMVRISPGSLATCGSLISAQICRRRSCALRSTVRVCAKAREASTRERRSVTPIANEWWLMASHAQICDCNFHGIARYIVTPEVAKHRFSSGSDRKRCPTAACTSSPATTIISSASCTRASTRLWAALAHHLVDGVSNDSDLHTTPPASKPSPSPGRRARSRRTIPACRPSARPRRSWCGCATRGSNPPDRCDRSSERSAVRIYGKRPPARTLTNLYNARPTWLDNAHRKLDAAVFAAYGWPATLSDEEILARLLALNLARAGGKRDE